MAALTTALNTEFTPAVGDFRIQVTAGRVRLLSRPAGVSEFADEVMLKAIETRLVCNVLTGTVYKFIEDQGSGSAARADQ